MILFTHHSVEQQLGLGSAEQLFHWVLAEATSAAGAGLSRMASLRCLGNLAGLLYLFFTWPFILLVG